MTDKKENKPSNENNRKTQIIAIIALIVSVITLWSNTLSPFDPKFDIGTISFIPSKSDQDNNLVRSTLGIAITFYNNGAKPGFIEDLAIVMTNKDNEKNKYIFFPHMYYDSKELFISRIEKKGEAYSLQGNFCGLYLPSKQVQFREIQFNMETADKALQPGIYKFTLYAKTKNGEFVKKDEIVQSVTEPTINSIGSGAINTIFPYSWRKEFSKKAQDVSD